MSCIDGKKCGFINWRLECENSDYQVIVHMMMESWCQWFSVLI